MRNVEQLALVVELACLTADRSKQEQAALVAVAARVDRERNRLSSTNPRLKEHGVRVCHGSGQWSTDVGTIEQARPFAPTDHKRTCACRGEGLFVAVQSELVREVETSWEPE